MLPEEPDPDLADKARLRKIKMEAGVCSDDHR